MPDRDICGQIAERRKDRRLWKAESLEAEEENENFIYGM